jgi:mannosyltransferase OCH1-like enzyme
MDSNRWKSLNPTKSNVWCNDDDFSESLLTHFNVFTNRKLVHQSIYDICIPKVLHFIWLGGNIPSKYIPMIDSWRQYHPLWDVRLWGDEDIISFETSNPKLFEILRNAPNYGMKSDILRYEVFYLFK